MFRTSRSFRVLVASLVMAGSARAQVQSVNLWPGIAPGSEGWTYVEKNLDDAPGGAIVVNVARPTLTAYLPRPDRATGTGVIIAPGGAFVALSIEQEGRAVARWLQQRGIAAFVLKYRLMEQRPGGTMPSMQEMGVAEKYAVADGLRAVRVLRQHARDWGVAPDRVGFIGFSAGGTVASSAWFSADAAERPNFAGILYGGPFGGPTSVPTGLPPLFLAWAQDDPIGENTAAKLFAALKAAGYRPETHAYSAGGHGFGMKSQGLSSDYWIDEFYRWLQSQGFARRQSKAVR